MPGKLFGTNGIRGPADTLFTKQFCIKLGSVFGQWLKTKGKTGVIAMAMDPRESSPQIKEGLCQGLANVGWDILDEGVVPTPALTYFVKNSPTVGGGVMVTGSHITANLNGVKLFIDGEEVTKDHEVEIEALFDSFAAPQSETVPVIKSEDEARSMYLDMLLNLADLPYPNWKIIVDTANGTQTQIVKDLFVHLGLEMECLGECDIQSPHFVPRDTETPDAVMDLTREVLAQKADLGVAFDVDGDRVVFVDDIGRFVPGDYSCSLIAAASSSSDIVTPISTSSVVDHIHKKVHRTKVGATYVIAKMKQVGSQFGFEANGGGISGDIFYGRDGATTMIKLLNLLKAEKTQLSVLYNNLPKYFLFKDKTDCPPELYSKIYESVKEKYADKNLETLDGIKVYLTDQEWILFRASGNAPEFRVFVQSQDEKRSQKLGQEGLDWVKSLILTRGQPARSHSTQAQDSLNIRVSAQHLADQCAQVLSDMADLDIPAACSLVDNIVVSGMGGSALGGRVVAALQKQSLKVPLLVSTEYHLPEFVNRKTLVVISSYSGNTEETLQTYAEARERSATIFVITTGGRLAELVKKDQVPAYIFTPNHNPSGQPRMGLGYSIMSLVSLLSRCQLMSPFTDLAHLPNFLQHSLAQTQTAADQVAKHLAGRIPVLVAAEHLVGVAHAVKNMLNENAKNMAVLVDLPEADHHLLEGLTYPTTNPDTLAFLFLESSHYHPEIKQRIQVTSQIVAKQHIPVLHLPVEGQSALMQVMWLIQVGALLSVEQARLNQVDPGPIPWVDYIKDQLAK